MNIKLKIPIILFFCLCCHQPDIENSDVINTSDLMDNYITDPKITISKKNIISLRASANFLTKNENEADFIVTNHYYQKKKST